MKQMYDVVIVGAGPAGLSAALYTSRMNLSTLILTSSVAGGQLLETEYIDNYLGSYSQDAYDLAKEMIRHSTEFGAELIEFETIINVDKCNGMFEIINDCGQKYLAKSVILATGTEHNKLQIDERDNFKGDGISYCAVCDAPYYQDKSVIVVGGGDTAFESALLLAEFATSVTIVIRSKERAKSYLIDAVNKLDNVEIIYGQVNSLSDDSKLSEISITTHDNEQVVKKADGMFVCIGSSPQYDYLSKNLDIDGYIKPDSNQQIIPGLFVAGDMMREKYRQVSIAVADGTIAALEAYDYITQLNEES